ncbi:ATPase SWSAP1 [Spea bombifrons]|uniref:ATPase SWSAP1 n=1 Tax=Spea bombifrons TaxID=233779 RepID=UPI00234AA7C0|nr:ATPase SWSAP1 [Spea bombifrons]
MCCAVAMANALRRVFYELSDPSELSVSGAAGSPGPERATSAVTGPQEPDYVCSATCGPQGPPLLLLGPPNSGKTGLLFLAAVMAAEEGAGPVIFLSRDPLQRLPWGGRTARDPLTLKQIRFLYPPTLDELLRLLSSLHLTPPSPSLILLDGLDRYLTSACGPQDGALLSALLLDSASHLRCGLLVSAGCPAERADGAFLAVERYFPAQCQLYPEGVSDVEDRRYSVAFNPLCPEWMLHIPQDGSLRLASLKSQEGLSPGGRRADVASPAGVPV